MQGTKKERRWLTVAEIAAERGISVDKVLQWLREGELVGVNVAQNANGKNPRWRVAPEALADFERRRSSAPPAKPSRRKQPASDSYTPKYYPQ
jgi:chromosome segregation and condensation protein ScpB